MIAPETLLRLVALALVAITRPTGRTEAARDLSDPMPAEMMVAGLQARVRSGLGCAAADRLSSTAETLGCLSARELSAQLVGGPA
jgi:hypothetical protein